MASVLFENGNECLSVYLFVVDDVVAAVVVSVLPAPKSSPRNEVNQLWQRKRRLMW